MSFKVFIKTIIFILSLAGCSTTKTTNVACDFVGGVYDASIEKQQKRNQGNIHGREVGNNHDSGIVEGILNVFAGMLNRSLKDDTSGKCT
jgi:uncharacterized Fe-S cluster-containing MiaB family protein